MYAPAEIAAPRTPDESMASGQLHGGAPVDPTRVASERMRLEIRPGTPERQAFSVRQFCPNYLIVDAITSWGDTQPTEARLEHVGPGGFVSQVRCSVQYLGETELDGRSATRLELHCEPRLAPRLRRFYREQCFPLLARHELPPAEVRELFVRSGYSKLRGSAGEPSQRWLETKLSSELSSDVIYCAQRDGALLGHVSVTRAYSRTWIGHQLATLRGHEESLACRIALYKHFSMVPGLHDGDRPHFMLGYYARSCRWHQTFFEGFVDWMDDPSEALTVPFARYELADEASMSVANAGPSLDVREARPKELRQVTKFIAAKLPPLARAAFDIRAKRLNRTFLAPIYASLGSLRSRRVFVLRAGERLLGVALCESGSPDLSLFDIFNLAQLYLADEATPEATAQLLALVRNYYRAIGRPKPMIVSRDELPAPATLGLEHVEQMGCIVWSGLALPRYREYLDECFAQISPEDLARAPDQTQPSK